MPRTRLPEWLDLDRLARTSPAEGWERNGACYETGNTDRFFQEGTLSREVLDLCGGCPARYACLRTAVNLSEFIDHGVWGGTSARMRRKIRSALAARRAA